MKKKKILLAPNSYKECSSSVEVSELFEKYLNTNNGFEIFKYPITDGGDGFLDVLNNNNQLINITYPITTPYDNSKFDCTVGYDKKNKIIYIESAKVLGLQLIHQEKRHPLFLSSKGLGELLDHIRKSVINKKININKVVIGVGGTGTNDLGLGLCSVFGMKLIDIDGKETDIIPEFYHNTDKILWSKPELPFIIETIVDVNIPLLGEAGATYQFAAQKGAMETEIELLELGFNKIINILNNNKLNILANSLSGAGGGLAAGLSHFFDAECTSSFENLRADKVLIRMMEQADYVITGEGIFDKTSLLGKGASAIIKISDNLNKKVFLCCGKIEKDSVKMLSKNIIPIEMNKKTIDNKYKKYFEEEVKIASSKIINLIFR
ncbi:MAG: glycerate kinase [Bacteroidetes bacterium]|nr:glycerate kinase [Bacteroidota bacterium]